MIQFFTFLFSNIKNIIFIVILTSIIVVLGILFLHVQQLNKYITTINEEKITLIANTKILEENVNTLKHNFNILNSTNLSNLKTIDQLLKERKESVSAIEKLTKRLSDNHNDIEKINGRLANILSDPKNDAALSTSLKETIREIQENRK